MQPSSARPLLLGNSDRNILIYFESVRYGLTLFLPSELTFSPVGQTFIFTSRRKFAYLQVIMPEYDINVNN